MHPDDTRTQDALRLVRASYVQLPVVIISEAASEALVLSALRLRAWDLLVRPLAPGELDDALARLAQERLPRSASPPGGAPIRPRRRSTHPATRFIRDNVHRPLSLADCARICNLSRCEFSRRFRAEQGVSFSEYVLRLRIQQAAALLTESRYSVSEAAFAVGFNDLSYFARVFRRFVGMPASLYRRSLASPA
jgi:AraC-like DNA-binding protein